MNADALHRHRCCSLLRGGLWGTPPDTILFEGEIDWPELLETARRQAILGLTFDGIALLPKELHPAQDLFLKWYNYVLRIEHENRTLNAALRYLVGKYRAAGCEPVLLKGQGLAQYYRQPLRRQSGDIDLLWTPDDYPTVNALTRTWEGAEAAEETLHHQAFELHGVTLENHHRYVYFYARRNERRWKELQRLLPLTGDERLQLDDFSVAVPTPQLNAIYVFVHLFHHFWQSGVGLRQVCDWVVLLHARREAIDAGLFRRSVELVPLRRAMAALGYVAERYLGLPASCLPLDTTTKQAQTDGEFMLRDIFATGNFGQDTAMMRGFNRRQSFARNFKSYLFALRRFAHVYRFCPSEIRAYPFRWVQAKLRKHL